MGSAIMLHSENRSADLLHCLSDGLTFCCLMSDASEIGPLSMISKYVLAFNKDTVLKDDNCEHTDLIKLSKH